VPRLSTDALILDPADYSAARSAARDRMIPLRRERRLRLGDQIVCEFENADTLLYQVQEMVYAEGIREPAEAAAEVEAYARMMPTSHELSATMFVELDDAATVRNELDRLEGVQRSIYIDLDGARVPATELPSPEGGAPDPRTYSVHFLRFRLTDEQRDAFRDPAVPAQLGVEHPAYADETPITGATRLSLLADLAFEPR
jgi:hypothetical protein